MKIKGIVVPLTANPNGEGKIVDMKALHESWLAQDAEEQGKRWEAFVKGFGEDLAVKAPWYPIFERAALDFWTSSKQFLYEKITGTVVVDMIFGRILKDHEISVENYAGVKNLLAEYLAENTSQDHDVEAIMWKDAAKGPGAKPYFNPHRRAEFTASRDD
jgi:hypothetical protein